MKKLLLSLDSEMYMKYKGLQNYLDHIARTIAEFNFGSSDCDVFMKQVMENANADTRNVCISPDNDVEYTIIHTKNSETLGTITRINLL